MQVTEDTFAITNQLSIQKQEWVWEQSSVENLELVAILLQPLDGFGQREMEFVDTFEGIVEGDDGTIAGIAPHIVEHPLGRHPFGVVAGHQVPHHDAVTPAQPEILVGPHPSVRWTKEVGMEQFVGLVGILAIVADGVFEPTDMIEGMVADAVSGCHHLLIEFGMFAHVVRHHEERRLDVVLA